MDKFNSVTLSKVPLDNSFDYVVYKKTTFTPSFHVLENRIQKNRMNETEIELDDVKNNKLATSKISKTQI